MIEKFLEKFLPQITERLNENEEVGKALIEALAVLDNYATLNNVQFTDEQVNTMLGVVPEPAPEPNADIPAEIVEIVEKKKRGRKPKAVTTAEPSTWSWRFRTEQEMKDEFGDSNWRKRWGGNMRDYLFGKSIPETPETIDFIDKVINKDLGIDVDTASLFGISNPNNSSATYFLFDKDNVTDKALPTAATPTWNWRFKTEQELQQEWGLNRWKNKVAWEHSGKMDYLLGKPIIESDLSKQFIQDLLKSSAVSVDTNYNLGIDSGSRNIWTISEELVTNKPLPTAAAPVKTEPKKRGRKPKGTATAWTWRFKTEKELRGEYGGNMTGSIPVMGSFTSEMFYLFGKPIEENDVSKKFIKDLKNEPYTLGMDTKNLGISNGVNDTFFSISFAMITDKPLPTAAAPTKSEPKKRGRKPKSALPEIDLGGLEDIGDIDIDAIDFDNLVI